MHVIFGNYGNETIGLIQWVFMKQLKNVFVASVDTGWANENWQIRVEQGETLSRHYSFNPIRLHSKLSFEQLIKERQNFPSTKFQWCAGFLKALPLLDWLDDVDPACEATILIANRRAMSRAQATLPEYIEESEHYGERKVWYPLYDYDDEMLFELINKTGMEQLIHRSLECDPCVNNSLADFSRIQDKDIEKTLKLEKKLGQPMFIPESYGENKNIEQVVHWVKKQDKSATLEHQEIFAMGCSSPFACGL